MQRYFVNNKNNNIVTIIGDDYHHMVNVMRMKIDDQIEISYNRNLYRGKIIDIKDDMVIVSLIEEREEHNELDINITIAQALVKEDKLDLILQKGTELGVNHFMPIMMKRCVIKINDKIDTKLNRWQKICKEASEQAKREVIPTVNRPMTIKELINLDFDIKILCSVTEKQNNLKLIFSKLKPSDKIVIVVGPEGGITKEEEQLLIDNGYIPVSLGNRILRTETVSLFVASIINYELMR